MLNASYQLRIRQSIQALDQMHSRIADCLSFVPPRLSLLIHSVAAIAPSLARNWLGLVWRLSYS
jgi:hypothetical protein